MSSLINLCRLSSLFSFLSINECISRLGFQSWRTCSWRLSSSQRCSDAGLEPRWGPQFCPAFQEKSHLSSPQLLPDENLFSILLSLHLPIPSLPLSSPFLSCLLLSLPLSSLPPYLSFYFFFWILIQIHRRGHRTYIQVDKWVKRDSLGASSLATGYSTACSLGSPALAPLGNNCLGLWDTLVHALLLYHQTFNSASDEFNLSRWR